MNKISPFSALKFKSFRYFRMTIAVVVQPTAANNTNKSPFVPNCNAERFSNVFVVTKRPATIMMPIPR